MFIINIENDAFLVPFIESESGRYRDMPVRLSERIRE
jgi:hypothetical protein